MSCAACRVQGVQARYSLPYMRAREGKEGFGPTHPYTPYTSTTVRARVDAAMRRLEVRIGELLGPSQHGGDRKSDARQVDHDRLDLSKDQRREFRRMADHPEVVEDVIAESTDEELAGAGFTDEAASTRETLHAPSPPAVTRKVTVAGRRKFTAAPRRAPGGDPPPPPPTGTSGETETPGGVA